jgi:hypothetical protein
MAGENLKYLYFLVAKFHIIFRANGYKMPEFALSYAA